MKKTYFDYFVLDTESQSGMHLTGKNKGQHYAVPMVTIKTDMMISLKKLTEIVAKMNHQLKQPEKHIAGSIDDSGVVWD